MKAFRRLALASTIAVYFLIFIGGLVRVSGAGLGCPDWPKCFGRWIPPTNISQLPSDMDPTLFNFTLAWIEYFNRLVGVTIGFLILGTAILAIRHYRKVRSVLFPAVGALILVAYQGWQGGQVVSSRLEPLFVSLHFIVAIAIAYLLIYATQQSYYHTYGNPESTAIYPKSIRLWVGILWGMGLAQLVLGTQVRASIEIIGRQLPSLNRIEVVRNIGSVNYIHDILGLLLALLTWYFGAKILLKSQSPSGAIKVGVVALMILVLAQLSFGLILISAGLPPLVQLFHLWVAAIYIGLVFVLYLALRRWKGGIELVKS